MLFPQGVAYYPGAMGRALGSHVYSNKIQKLSAVAAEAEEKVRVADHLWYEGPSELSIGDTIRINYIPKEFEPLYFLGGFGWDGNDKPMTLPMIPSGDGSYRVSVNLPNFAKSLDFCFSDGVRYDSNDGKLYHIMVSMKRGNSYRQIIELLVIKLIPNLEPTVFPCLMIFLLFGDGFQVTNIQMPEDDGTIISYRQEADGSLSRTGIIKKQDPQELQKMVDASVKKNINKDLEVKITVDEQTRVQEMRADAARLAKDLGLSNMLANEARDAFDRFADRRRDLLPFSKLAEVFSLLGFDLEEQELTSLILKYTLDKNPTATTINIREFMLMFAELDTADTGIDMV